jgi:hypothetical protein
MAKLIVAHQLRVHLQYLGFPIANDPLYSLENVWGSNLGQGGVELAAQNAEYSQAAAIAKRVVEAASGSRTAEKMGEDRLSDLRSERDMADIDVSSPIRLSQQAKDVIYKLRQMKDEAEDWVKYVPLSLYRSIADE